MSVVIGNQNNWQTGNINGAPHAIEKCGSHPDLTVRAVAFCQDEATASLLVDALKYIKQIHDANPTRSETAKAILERAGLI